MHGIIWPVTASISSCGIAGPFEIDAWVVIVRWFQGFDGSRLLPSPRDARIGAKTCAHVPHQPSPTTTFSSLRKITHRRSKYGPNKREATAWFPHRSLSAPKIDQLVFNTFSLLSTTRNRSSSQQASLNLSTSCSSTLNSLRWLFSQHWSLEDLSTWFHATRAMRSLMLVETHQPRHLQRRLQ
jgi:hypothetical protein